MKYVIINFIIHTIKINIRTCVCNNVYIQARQLQEDWRYLTAHQKQKEQELEMKEKELIRRREMLELERRNLLNEVKYCKFLLRMHNYYFFIIILRRYHRNVVSYKNLKLTYL